MRRKIVPIVDLFSGPGGLGEGFSAYRSPGDRRRYRAALSIEKDPSAYRTLRLRAFLRKFRAGFPPEYYDFLNGVIPKEPDWAKLYPKHWTAACDETRCLELGTSSASTFLEQRIARIRTEHEGRTVLLGGPPCQVYSVAGRSRNSGKIGYDADEDDRQLLYEPYVQVLSQLQPAIAVMENVKGMLSARRNGRLIFPEVMRKLRHAGSINAYQLFALAPPSGICSWDEASKPRDFLVHAEEHSVPQARHRVFVICVRRDVAEALPEECLPRLDRQDGTVSVRDIISAMPKLRSRLSQNDDPGSWQDAVRSVCELILAHRPMMSQDEERRFRMALGRALLTAKGAAPPWREARGGLALPSGCPADLRDWISDEKIEVLPNNETRRHIPADLARYLFAAAFVRAFGRSPKTPDFPEALMPDHANWSTGMFDDRYRVQLLDGPSTTVTSHLSKDGHYFIHPDPAQCRSFTVREAARLQTFPDNYLFHGSRTQQYIQVGNAVPPFLAWQIARAVWGIIDHHDHIAARTRPRVRPSLGRQPVVALHRPLDRQNTKGDFCATGKA